MQQKPVDLVDWRRKGAHFISRNNFANLGSFAKVSVPVIIINFVELSHQRESCLFYVA